MNIYFFLFSSCILNRFLIETNIIYISDVLLFCGPDGERRWPLMTLLYLC